MDGVRVLRGVGAGAFAACSVAAFILSLEGPSAAAVEGAVLMGYAALGAGVLLRRPDLEVLGWTLAGTGLLLAMVGARAGFPYTMLAAVGVVAAADLQHSVAVLYPGGGESLDSPQEAARTRVLAKRGGAAGLTAGGSLACSFLGVFLAPPLESPGSPAAVVAVVGVAALAVVSVGVLSGIGVGGSERRTPTTAP